MIIQAISTFVATRTELEPMYITGTRVVCGYLEKKVSSGKFSAQHKESIGFGFTPAEAITNCLNALKK